jgi:hypothetical protein
MQIDWPFAKENLLFAIHPSFHYLLPVGFPHYVRIGIHVAGTLFFCILSHSSFSF